MAEGGGHRQRASTQLRDYCPPVMWALVRDELPRLELVCREALAAAQTEEG